MRQREAADLRLIVMFLRSLRRWTQEELSKASGVDRGLISDYELGNKAPTIRTLERLTAAVGLPFSFVETLLPIFRSARLAMEGGRAAAHRSDASGKLGDGLDRAILDAVLPSLAPYVMELEALLNEPEEQG
jgi:transcriptional regulator with XRE-family HTH domain